MYIIAVSYTHLVGYLQSTGEHFKVMVLPDHPTPIRLRTHTIDPVPFLIYDSENEQVGVDTFDEDSAATTGFYLPTGYRLLDYFIEKAK